MKYESRRYNKNETGKEFYLRRKKEMNEALESDAYKQWSKKIWAEYKEINKSNISIKKKVDLIYNFMKTQREISQGSALQSFYESR